MSSIPSNELRRFQVFLNEKLDSGHSDLRPEDVLNEWRDQNPDPDEFEEEVAAIQAALTDVANGDHGISFAEFDRDFRREHNIRDSQ
jgi:hypothetical protein